MGKINTTEIKKNLKIIQEIFLRCNDIFEDIKYIGTVDEVEKEIIENTGYLLRQIDYEWRLLIIELQKLYKEKESYSIKKLLNNLENNFRLIQWDTKIELQVIKDLQLKFEQKNIQESIKALNILRTKFVAHIDADRHLFNDEINTWQVELLIILGHEILSEVENSLTGETTYFNYFKFSGLESIVKKIKNLQEIKRNYN
jgi:hypothetical protein